MSVEHKFSRAKDEEDPKHPGNLELTITITGAHDIYRFAHMMLFGQVEFSQRARKVIGSLKSKMAPGQWAHMDRSLGGWQLRGAREPAATLPTTERQS